MTGFVTVGMSESGRSVDIQSEKLLERIRMSIFKGTAPRRGGEGKEQITSISLQKERKMTPAIPVGVRADNATSP